MSAMKSPIPIKRESEQSTPEAGAVPATYGWEPFSSLRQQLDRLFDDLTSGWGATGRALENAPWAGWGRAPAADIVEKQNEFEVTLDLPGMDETDIEVNVMDGMISIRGEKTEETKEEKEHYRLSERRHGSFLRSFALPPSVDPDKIAASYDKGILKITMPKSEEAKKKQRKVEVKAA